MRSTREFLKDGITLTLTAILLRTAGVYFSAKLSVVAGNAVMGLYTQIMTVYAFAVTAASAGINLGSTRVVSECYGSGEHGAIQNAVNVSLRYCLTTGLSVGALSFLSSPLIGAKIIGDARAVSSVRALSLALPFIAVSNALHGYFNGVKEIPKSAFTSLFEQFSRIGATLLALNALKNADTETLCVTLVTCNALSEVLSCLILAIFYKRSIKRFKAEHFKNPALKARFKGITLPIAASSLIRSMLTTVEHLLIPIGLREYGATNEGSFAKYGIMSGMVLPVLLYPMALLSSFASVTISELSARKSSGEGKKEIALTVTKGTTFALYYGIGCATLICCFSERLGNVIYKSTEAGELIRLCSVLIIFMYLDHISDGMLKGLDKQRYVMKVNIFDASLSVIFALILIPRFGINGFIASLYVCEIMNCFFSFGKLYVMLHPDIKVMNSFIIPLACAMIASHSLAYIDTEEGLILPLLFGTVIYILLLKVCGSLDVFKRDTIATHKLSIPSVHQKTVNEIR